MKKISSALALFLILMPNVWAHTATVTDIGKSPYKAIVLTPEFYNNVGAELDGILLKDAKEQEVPYFIHSAGECTEEKPLHMKYVSLPFTVKEQDSNTCISITGAKNLKLSSIYIETQSSFRRDVSALGVTEELYNWSFAEDHAEIDTTIDLQGEISREAELIVKIVNQSDNPIVVEGITVRYFSDIILFADQNSSSYTIEFGNTNSTPVYDIASYQYEILQQPIDILEINSIHLKEESTPLVKDYQKAFDIVVVLVAVFLGLIILRKLKK